MAPPAGTLRVGRYFAVLLAIFAVLYAIVLWPGSRHTPKLGIDLAGGTEIIFTAKTAHGQTPSSSSMEQAKQIMTDRVNGTGVTESTVVIQGSDQLVVSIPGKEDENASDLGRAAVLNLRPAVAGGVPVNCTPPGTAKATASPSAGASGSTSPSSSPSSSTGASSAKSPSASESGAVAAARPLGAASPSAPTSSKSSSSSPSSGASGSRTPSGASTPSGTGSGTGTTGASVTPTPSASSSAPPPACTSNPIATVAKAGKFTVPLSDTAYNALSASNQELVQAALANFNCDAGQTEEDIATSYFVACNSSGYAFLLGPVIVPGKQISTASAAAPNFGTGGSSQWTVDLTLSTTGLKKWAAYTAAHHEASGSTSSTNTAGAAGCTFAADRCANYVGFTLDGAVISFPVNESTINTNPTEISGSFTESSAKELANQLKYGALPVSFKLESSEPVSATLGSSQLKAGLLAGGIGLALVVLYSLIYYRALGLVTIASLIVSGGLTYGSLVMLATQIDFTLSLAGIAGFIVAVGITADSFVVFFERMKDEVHEGRSARVAIPRAWVRARRTILSADTVSFLAAAILYYFAAGDVRGFAFTLGLSTILDLVVVFLFTHPLVSFLARFDSFGSARFTGLDAIRGGPAISETTAAVSKPAKGKPAKDAKGKVAQSSPAPASTAVLEDGEPAAEPPTETGQGADTAAEEAVERRRVTPEAGSAAERAAARRAKLREERDNDPKGTS